MPWATSGRFPSSRAISATSRMIAGRRNRVRQCEAAISANRANHRPDRRREEGNPAREVGRIGFERRPERVHLGSQRGRKDQQGNRARRTPAPDATSFVDQGTRLRHAQAENAHAIGIGRPRSRLNVPSRGIPPAPSAPALIASHGWRAGRLGAAPVVTRTNHGRLPTSPPSACYPAARAGNPNRVRHTVSSRVFFSRRRRYHSVLRSLVPASLREPPKRDQPDERNDDPDPETPDDRENNSDDHEDPAEADSTHRSTCSVRHLYSLFAGSDTSRPLALFSARHVRFRNVRAFCSELRESLPRDSTSDGPPGRRR